MTIAGDAIDKDIVPFPTDASILKSDVVLKSE